MMKKPLAILFLAPTFILPACGDDDDDDKGPIEEVQATTANLLESHNLPGDWTAGCAGFDGFADILDISAKETISFGGNNLTKSYALYEDSECQNMVGKITYKGNYELEDDSQGRSDYVEIDSTFKNVEVTPQTEFLVNALNEVSWCGNSSWAQGQTVEITGDLGQGSCQLPVSLNTETYGLVKVDNDTLYMATPLTAAPADENNRPGDVNQEVKYQRQ
jgi:hypothetical protein